MVEACFNRLTRVSNVELFAYEDECSFSRLGFCTAVSQMGTSSHWEVNSIECLANNHKSSCIMIITIEKKMSVSHCLKIWAE